MQFSSSDIVQMKIQRSFLRVCFERLTCGECVEKNDNLPIVTINTSAVSIDKFMFFMNEFKLEPFLQGNTKEKSLFDYLKKYNYSGIIACREIQFCFELEEALEKA